MILTLQNTSSHYDYFGARYYDARIGRWGSIDPMLEKHYGFNPYNYVLNNTYVFTDPGGKQVDQSEEERIADFIAVEAGKAIIEAVTPPPVKVVIKASKIYETIKPFDLGEGIGKRRETIAAIYETDADQDFTLDSQDEINNLSEKQQVWDKIVTSKPNEYEISDRLKPKNVKYISRNDRGKKQKELFEKATIHLKANQFKAFKNFINYGKPATQAKISN